MTTGHGVERHWKT